VSLSPVQNQALGPQNAGFRVDRGPAKRFDMGHGGCACPIPDCTHEPSQSPAAERTKFLR